MKMKIEFTINKSIVKHAIAYLMREKAKITKKAILKEVRTALEADGTSWNDFEFSTTVICGPSIDEILKKREEEISFILKKYWSA